jgi:uncharacterized Tic20 family protein
MSDSQGTPDFEKKPEQPQAQQPYGQQPYAGQPQQYGAPQPPQYGAPPLGAPAALPPDQERLWGGAAHWSALVASVVGLAFLGPLIVMLTKGNESAFVRRQAVESLNFQLSMLIYGVVSLVLWLILVGILLSIVVGIVWLVFTILGAIKASNGEDYRYPLTLRMVN